MPGLGYSNATTSSVTVHCCLFKKKLSIGYNCNATAIRPPRDFQESNSRAKVAWRSNRSPLTVVTSLILVCRGHSNKLDKYTNYVAYKHKFIRSKKWFIIMPRPWVGALSNDARLTSVCRIHRA